MPINTYTPGFNQQQDQSRQAQSLQELLGKQIMQNQEVKANAEKQQVAGQQNLQEIGAKKDADIEKEKAIQSGNLNLVNQLHSQNPNAKIATGQGGSVMIDPEMAALLKNQNAQAGKAANQAKDFGKNYDKAMDPYVSAFTSVNAIHSGLDQNTAQGDKIAATNAARIAEGKGQRLFQGLVQSFGLDPSLYKTSQDVENYFSSNPQSKLSEPARDAMRKVAISHYNNIAPEYEAKRGEMMSRAAYEAPAAAQNGYLNSVGQAGETLYKSLGDKNKTYQASMDQRQATPQQSPLQAAGNTVVDKLKSFLGGSRQPSQMGSPGANTQSYDGSTSLPPGATQDMQSTRLQYLQRKAGG